MSTLQYKKNFYQILTVTKIKIFNRFLCLNINFDSLLFRQSRLHFQRNFDIIKRKKCFSRSTVALTLKSFMQEYARFPNTLQLKYCHQSVQTFNQSKKAMDVPVGLFRGTVDRFNGVTITSQQEFDAQCDFSAKLQKSIEYWIKIKRRAIWFHIGNEHSDWIPHLAKNGFAFHHIEKASLCMYRWLPTDEFDNVPVYAHTMVGVGGLVINDANEILVVTDRFALIPKSLKLPGGYVEPSENLINAAVREVKEETGVDCKFNTVVSIRHTHGGNFGCSDLYVVIGLTPSSSQLAPCEREIACAKWIPVAEYLQHPNVHETNRHFVRTFLDYKKQGIRFTCELGKHQVLKKDYCLYYIKTLEQKDEDEIKV